MERTVTAENGSYRSLDVPVRGGQLRVGVWGPEGGDVPTILAVHGVTASHRAWPMVAAALPGVRVVAPDLRGRGRSAGLPGPYGMPQHADDLAAVLDALAVRRAVVVGHSMGAFVSAVFAHRHADRVRSLVLVDGGLPLAAPEGLTGDALVYAILGPAAERLAMTFPDRASYRAFWRAHPAFGDGWNDTMAQYVDYDLVGEEPTLHPATAYAAVAEDTAELHAGPSLMAALDALAHPTVFLRAPRGLMNELPGLYSPDQVAGWSDRLAGLRVVEVDDVNHYTIIMSDHGVDAVTAEIRQALAASDEPVGAVGGRGAEHPAEVHP
jgi:lipase